MSLLSEENDREALRWAGPFGYAVLEVLRAGDEYGEADFQALMARGRALMADPERPPNVPEPKPSPVTDPMPPADWYRPVNRPGGGGTGGTGGTGGAVPTRAPLSGAPTTTVYRPAGERDASGRFVKRI